MNINWLLNTTKTADDIKKKCEEMKKLRGLNYAERKTMTTDRMKKLKEVDGQRQAMLEEMREKRPEIAKKMESIEGKITANKLAAAKSMAERN